MSREIPKENEIWQHYKGNKYRIICIASADNTSEELVVYRSLHNNATRAKPIKEFMQILGNSKTRYYRFQKVE